MRVVVVVIVVSFAGCGQVRPDVRPDDAPAVRVVDTRAAVPSLPHLEPGLTPRPLRGRIDTGPVACDDDGGDFALDDRGARGHWVLPGQVGGQPVRVIVDTGSERTLVAPDLARTLHLLAVPGTEGKLHDAAGEIGSTVEVDLPDVVVAGVAFRGLRALVPHTASRSDLFLLGQDALNHVDTVVDGVAGTLAFFSPGQSLQSIGDDGDVVALDVAGGWGVTGAAVGKAGPISFHFGIDTGSPLTSVAAGPAIAAGLPADVSRTATLQGVAGVAVERRGRFWLSPLSLGLLSIGNVSALETQNERGLVGTDALARGRVLFSPARHALVVFPTVAHAGPCTKGGANAVTITQRSLASDFDVVVTDALPLGAHFLLRPHDPNSGGPAGGAVEVVIARPGTHHIETHQHFFAHQWSMVMLPPTKPCSSVCLNLLGDWPRADARTELDDLLRR